MHVKKISIIRKTLKIPGLVALLALVCAGAMWGAQGIPGAVYVMTNASSGNAIMAFRRAANGTLTAAGTYSTGGLGFGTGADPLGSQGSLILTSDGHFLLAVNAGSNDVSVMQVGSRGLSLVSKVSSGGTEPISVTLYKNLAYVLNAGGTPNISGFVLGPTGILHAVAGSSRPLAGGTSAGPAEISFAPNGSFLVVTEKGTNLIDTYQVMANGLTMGPTSNASNGMTPFGFSFGGLGALITSEAFGGGSGLGAASSYRITGAGTLRMVSGSVGDTQTAPCWVVVTSNGSFAFLSNTASGTISSYTVKPGGALTLLNGVAGSTGSSSVATDEALSSTNQFLYVLTPGANSISAFQVDGAGGLMQITGAANVPTTAQGIAAE
jgi:6-phosphogluconolactonase